jgi:multisubunit Na+/H+ antiporter MnhB subunit
MSFQERRTLVTLISDIVVNMGFIVYMLPRYPQAEAYSVEIFHFWGTYFLGLILVTIIANIVVSIVFNILNAIATQEDQNLMDERDKLIELRATQNALYVFAIGFLVAMFTLVLNMPPATMFVILLCAGIASETISELSKFFLYRRGF